MYIIRYIKKCVRQMLNVLNYAAQKKKKKVLNYVLFFVYEQRKCAKATAKNYSHWVYSILCIVLLPLSSSSSSSSSSFFIFSFG